MDSGVATVQGGNPFGLIFRAIDLYSSEARRDTGDDVTGYTRDYATCVVLSASPAT